MFTEIMYLADVNTMERISMPNFTIRGTLS